MKDIKLIKIIELAKSDAEIIKNIIKDEFYSRLIYFSEKAVTQIHKI